MNDTQLKHLIQLKRTYFRLSLTCPGYKQEGLKCLISIKKELNRRNDEVIQENKVIQFRVNLFKKAA